MPNQARITVIETIYFQSPDSQPIGTEDRTLITLDTDEQPYIRNLTIGPEWKRLDAGWLETASLIHLRNNEGTYLDKHPTEEERAEMNGRIVEIAGDQTPPFALVRPGRSIRMEPYCLDSTFLRCCSGSAKCTLTIFPK